MRVLSIACIICILSIALGEALGHERDYIEITGQSLENRIRDKFHLLTSKSDFRSRKNKALLSDRENEFFIKDTNQTVYFDDTNEQWYIYQNSGLGNPIADTRIPLTWCYDTVGGGKGAINHAFEILLSAEQVFSNEGKVEGILQIKGTLILGNLGVSLSESITFKGAHSCEVEPAQFARIYLKPFYQEVFEGLRVAVVFDDQQGLKEVGGWQKTSSFKRFSPLPPLIECALGAEPEICDLGIL